MRIVNDSEGMPWIEKAEEIARKSLCLRTRCGSIIVRDGEIIASGYNAPPRDDVAQRICLDAGGQPSKTCCVHAEQRAIMQAMRDNPDKLTGARLYFIRLDQAGNKKRSGKPTCTVCSRWALDAGIAEFVLWHQEGVCVYDTQEYNTLSIQNSNEK